MRDKMKIKKGIDTIKLPSRGRYYGSEQPMTELFLIIDRVVQAPPARCDCDKSYRCWNHRTESIVEIIKGRLKKEIMEIFED